jgi:2-polyprenyl-3-methyl-5-hydroxy-6-metoxy-1,4-benzoquinol methylase
MDAPGLDGERHVRALRGLARINALSLSARRIWTRIENLSPPKDRPLRILDVACGGGDVAIAIKSRADKAGRLIEVEGCDISPVAVEFAAKSAQRRGLEVRFFQHDALEKELPGGFDLVSSSLFLHHLSDSDSVAFLRDLAAVGQAVLVQDLLRTRMGYLLALSTVRVITRSRVVRADGPRSVRAAYSLPEVERLASRAGLEGARIERCWPERFSLSWGQS